MFILPQVLDNLFRQVGQLLLQSIGGMFHLVNDHVEKYLVVLDGLHLIRGGHSLRPI